MKKQIKAALKKQREIYQIISICDNPQSIEQALIIKGRIEALEAVLDALCGNNCLLNLLK